MAKNIYQTAQGLQVNIDQMRLVNEGSIAVGNIPVNARGDQVAPNGQVIKSRNEIMKDHYSRHIEPVVKYNPNKKQQRLAALQGTMPEEVAYVPPPAPAVVGQHQQLSTAPSSDLRGSLASTVGIDLTETPTQTNKTIRRI